MPLAVATLALGVRVFQPGPLVVVWDEHLWLGRAERAYAGLASGHLATFTPAGTVKGATMPGVTTMWVGVLARVVGRLGQMVGLSDASLTPFSQSASGLRIAHVLMAIISASLIAIVAILGRRLLDPIAGAVMGVLLAVEPVMVANGILLHTDGLLTLTLAVSLLALLAGLHAGSELAPPSPSLRLIALSGVFVGLALATKVSALLFLPGLGIVGAWCLLRLPSRRRYHAIRAAGLWLASALTTVVLIWPALWVDPATQWSATVTSARQGTEGFNNYFLGQANDAPGALFYPVAMVLRWSPWLILGAVSALVGALLQRRSPVHRRLVLLLTIVPIPYLLAMTLGDKKVDRYALPALPPLAFATAVGVSLLWLRVGNRLDLAGRARLHPVGVLAALLLAGPVLVANPHALAWFDPVVGGAQRASRTLVIGRGEGLELVGRRIKQIEGSHCADVSVMVTFRLPGTAFPCGKLIRPDPAAFSSRSEAPDYAVLYVAQSQRELQTEFARKVRSTGRLILAVRLDGVVYATLWRTR
jgi:hypothetical protein